MQEIGPSVSGILGVAIINGVSQSGWKRALVNPPLIAVSLRFSGAEAWIPNSVLAAVGSLGSCAVPMGLALSGAIIVDFVLESSWERSAAMVVSAIGIRQLVMPNLMLGIASAVIETATRVVLATSVAVIFLIPF